MTTDNQGPTSNDRQVKATDKVPVRKSDELTAKQLADLHAVALRTPLDVKPNTDAEINEIFDSIRRSAALLNTNNKAP